MLPKNLEGWSFIFQKISKHANLSKPKLFAERVGLQIWWPGVGVILEQVLKWLKHLVFKYVTKVSWFKTNVLFWSFSGVFTKSKKVKIFQWAQSDFFFTCYFQARGNFGAVDFLPWFQAGIKCCDLRFIQDERTILHLALFNRGSNENLIEKTTHPAFFAPFEIPNDSNNPCGYTEHAGKSDYRII